MPKLIRSFVISFLLLGLVFGYLFWREVAFVRSYPINSWTQDQSADCAVVLTGSPGRVREGFDLLVHSRVKKLIISGVFPGARLREIFPQWPYYNGLRAEDVVLERQSKTTFGNAQQSYALMEALGCRDIILVTTEVHMYRAYRTFRKMVPESINILPRSVPFGRIPAERSDVYFEAFKSLFYSLWAY